MSKERKGWKVLIMVGLMTLMASPAFARTISMKDAGIGLWIFVIVGAVIVLLQLIPAAILFFSFIGTGSAMVFKGKKATEEGTEVLPEVEAAAVKK
jgi:hypothetical protein